MPLRPHFRLPRRRVPAPLAVVATLSAGLAALALPAGHESASVWALLAAWFPESAQSCFALGWATFCGALGYLAAAAVAQRRLLRPAITAALAATLLSPAALAAPLWAALIAGALLLACPAPPRLRAANDNPAEDDPRAHPFALAA